METSKEQDWKEIIRPSNNLLSLNLKELWEFRDLLLILTRRDITAIYKQTILGPLWFFLQPALTTLVYILVFSKAGKLSTGNLPPVLFYVSGLVLWMYFADCVLKTAGFLKENTAILSKVYFPRLIIPISIVMTNLIKLGIQLLLFFLVYVYFLVKDPSIKPNIYALLFPALTFVLGLLGLATGILVSSLTTRYKDLSHLITFAIQLLMFASPVIFPISAIENETARLFIQLNPVSGIIEAFRFGFLGGGYFSWSLLAYDTIFTLALSFFSILCFNAVEKKFVDTI